MLDMSHQVKEECLVPLNSSYNDKTRSNDDEDDEDDRWERPTGRAEQQASGRRRSSFAMLFHFALVCTYTFVAVILTTYARQSLCRCEASCPDRLTYCMSFK